MEKPLQNKIKNFGFTLLEIVFYLGIFLIATFITTAYMSSSYRTLRFGNELNAAIRSAQKGVDTMVKEIREARTADNGAYALVKADDHEFIFYSDIDQDDAVERVRYFLNGTDFIKGVVKPTGTPLSYPVDPVANETTFVLSEYVRNGSAPIFYYYDGDWPGDDINDFLPTPSRLVDTKLMRVYLKINVNPLVQPGDFELESSAQIRNLKTNL